MFLYDFFEVTKLIKDGDKGQLEPHVVAYVREDLEAALHALSWDMFEEETWTRSELVEWGFEVDEDLGPQLAARLDDVFHFDTWHGQYVLSQEVGPLYVGDRTFVISGLQSHGDGCDGMHAITLLNQLSDFL